MQYRNVQRIAWPLALAALFAAGASMAQTPPDAATIVGHGNAKGAPACSACHGADGGGQSAAGFPRLAGLNAAYLKHQLDSFADGTRENAVMQPVAKALSEPERQALATYYSQLPIPKAAQGAVTPAKNALGQKLARHGDWSRQVPGCETCHGPHGIGVGKHFPPLAGQSAVYIANELRDWQQGTRHNDPLDLMKHVASALTDADIKAVSAWFAAQPATSEGGKP